MAAIVFQIEVVEPNLGLIIARQLEEKAFRLKPGSRLAGCSLLAMSQPLPAGDDGEPRLDIYAFRLRDRGDAARFNVGQNVELSDWDEPARIHP